MPQVTELAWILSTVTPMGLLERAHSYKDKVARGLPASAGLFTYPVLMAADILIYDSDVVPVGHDQKQHLEMTRDIAIKMNETFGEIFKLPEPRIQAATETVPGPRRPEDEQELRQHDRHFRRRKGDAETGHEHRDRLDAGGGAERSRCVDDFPALLAFRDAEEEMAAMREAFAKGGTGYGDFKKQLFARLWEFFAPMRKRRKEILASPVTSTKCSRVGGAANAIANEVMARVRSAVGLR